MDLSAINHDIDRWGAACTAEDEPRAVVRLSELVKMLIDDKTPLQLAEFKVASALEASGIARWFLFRRGGPVAALGEQDIWLEPGTRHAKTREDGVTDWLRDWELIPTSDQPGDGKHGSFFFFDLDLDEFEDDVWSMRGTRGLMLCLHRSLTSADSLADLDDQDAVANQVALLEEDAAALLLRLTSPQLSLVAETAPPAAERKPGMSVDGLPLDADLLAEARDGRLKIPHGTQTRLAKKYGCSADTIARRLKRAATAEAEEEAQQRRSSVWGGLVERPDMS